MGNTSGDWEPVKLHLERYKFSIRGLQVMNGGGAVALLTFLGQTWNEAPTLRIPVVISIALFVGGLFAAVMASLYYGPPIEVDDPKEWAELRERNEDAVSNRIVISVALFFIGTVVVLAWIAWLSF